MFSFVEPQVEMDLNGGASCLSKHLLENSDPRERLVRVQELPFPSESERFDLNDWVRN